ncbi:MAG: Ig-like domain-containing protein [Myxococcota bacterium]
MSTRARWLCLALVLPLFACGPAPQKDAGTDDLIPPTIVSTSPRAGADGVDLQAPVIVTFSEAVAPETVSISATPAVTFRELTLDEDAITVTAVPVGPYTGGTLYTVSVAAKDVAGNSLSGLSSFSFTTRTVDTTAPTLVSSVPANGATDVALASGIALTFSEPMDLATVSVALTPTSELGVPTWSSDSTHVEFTPVAPLTATTAYTLQIAGQDLVGNVMTPVTVGFTTGTPPDTTPPTVVETVPSNGDTGVSNNTLISITFSEPMQQAATEGALSLSAGSTTLTNCNARWLWNGARTMVSCQPEPVLAFSTLHRVVISVAARDDANNALAAEYAFSFTVGSAPDTTPPTISSVSPADAEKGVERNEQIEVAFSEAMDTAATQGATSCVVGSTPVGGAFSWTNRNRLMRFSPSASFAHGATVSCRVLGGSSGARDVAGNRMAANKTWSFTVLRSATVAVPPVATLDGYLFNTGSGSSGSTTALVGDNAGNLSARSFVTFSLVEIPTSARRVTTAIMYLAFTGVLGDPADLGTLSLESIDVGSSLSSADFSSTPFRSTGWSVSFTTGTKGVSVLTMVNDDLTNRTARGNRSAFRLRFATEVTANGATDGIVIGMTEYATESLRPRLTITYEYP